jgi:antitoxin ParD1/3/4
MIDQPKRPHSNLAKFCHIGHYASMSTMNISLPETLKAFVDDQVTEGGYSTSSEYVRELIRRDQDRQQLKGLLLQGAKSKQGAVADATYFDGLRQKLKQRKKR